MKMVTACILIKTIPTRIENILKALKEFKETVKTYVVFGRWDLVAYLQIDDYHDLKEITSRINSIEGVRSTETLIES